MLTQELASAIEGYDSGALVIRRGDYHKFNVAFEAAREELHKAFSAQGLSVEQTTISEKTYFTNYTSNHEAPFQDVSITRSLGCQIRW
jgi:hypothetical protein